MSKIKTKLLSQGTEKTLIEDKIKDNLDLEGYNGDFTAYDISLNLSAEFIVSYNRVDSNLVITLSDGQTIVIKNFFSEHENGSKDRLFLSEDAVIEHIDLSYLEPQSALGATTTSETTATATSVAANPGLVFAGAAGGSVSSALTTARIATAGVGAATTTGALVTNNSSDDSDTQAPAAPVINEATETGVSGTAEPGSTVSVTIGGQEFTVPTDPVTGAFTVSPPEGTTFPADEPIVVVAIDPNGNQSPEGTGNIVDVEAPDAPVISEATETGVSGVAEPGSTVRLSIGGQEFTVPTDPVTGAFTITPSEGTTFPADEPIVVVAIDPNGNQSSEGTGNIVDVEAPAAPVINEATETGVSGMAEPGSTVTVTIGGQEFTVLADPETGAFTVAPIEGETFPVEASIVATTVDPQGNESSESTSNIVDVDAPAAPVISESTETSVSGTAEPGSIVSVTVGGQEFTVPTDPVTGVFTVTPPEGNTFPVDEPVTAVAVDPQGNESSEGTGNITDIEAPAAPVINEATETSVSGTAEPGSTVTVTVGGQEFTVPTDPQTGAFTVAPIEGTTFPAEAAVVATAIDPQGNESPESTGNITDVEAPSAPVIFEATETGVSGTAEPGSTVTITVGGQEFTVPTDPVTGVFSVSPPEGTTFPVDEPVTAVAVDPQGNESSEGAGNITDVEAPAAPVISEATETSVSGTAEPGSSVTVTVGGQEFTVPTDPVTGVFSVSPPEGTTFPVDVPVTAVAVDPQGNESSEGAGNIVDNIPPAVPTIDQQLSNEAAPIITGTAEANSIVSVEIGGATFEVIANEEGQFSVDTATAEAVSGIFAPNLNGVNEVIATSIDAAGNETSDSSTGEIVIDTTAPEAPTVDPVTINTTTPTLTGSVDLGEGEALSVTIDGETYTIENGLEIDEDGNWTLTLPEDAALEEGTFDVVATVMDAAGNETSDSSTNEIVIDTTAPQAPTVDPITTNTTTPTLTGSVDLGEGETLSVTIDGETYTTENGLEIDEEGNWTLTLPEEAALEEGTFDVMATVTDLSLIHI